MANWQTEINLTEVWETNDVQLVSAVIEKQLTAATKHPEILANRVALAIATELIEVFRAFVLDGEEDVEDFDDAVIRLYDWGDMALDGKWNGKKVCWIRTFL